jgi:hypothetical protein
LSASKHAHAEKPNNPLQRKGFLGWLYSVHYSRGKSAHYTTVGSIVSTIAVRPAATKKSRLSYLLTASQVLYELAVVVDASHYHQINCYACAKDKRCNVRKLTLHF